MQRSANLRASNVPWYALGCLSSEYGLAGLVFAFFSETITSSFAGFILNMFLLIQLCNMRIILSPSLLNGTGTISGDLHSVYLKRSNTSGFNVSYLL